MNMIKDLIFMMGFVAAVYAVGGVVFYIIYYTVKWWRKPAPRSGGCPIEKELDGRGLGHEYNNFKE